MDDNNIAIYFNKKMEYPDKYMHRPNKNYPEYPFDDEIQVKNDVYEGVRETFHLLGYDHERYGMPEWNPLGDIIQPNDNVLIKPNLVMHENRGEGGTQCLYTQVSLVAAVVDFVIIALKGKGKIIIADAPMQDCDFKRLVEDSGYKALIEYYDNKRLGISFELLDLRGAIAKSENGILVHEYKSENDDILVKLDQDSEFANCSSDELKRMRITNYDPNILMKYHNEYTHSYRIARPVLDANVIINMPKIKTHRKAGVTLSLKNIVGIIYRKECLPHHTLGDVVHGGDEYRYPNKLKEVFSIRLDTRNRLQEQGKTQQVKFINWELKLLRKIIKLCSKDNYSEGSWFGNKTICRTIVDLNKILFYADKKGNIKNNIQRKVLIVGDMVIAGEKNGPLCPSPKKVGAVVAAKNPVSFDTAIATLMGAIPEKIPTIVSACKIQHKNTDKSLDVNKIVLFSNSLKYNEKTLAQIKTEDIFYFQPINEWEEAFLKE